MLECHLSPLTFDFYMPETFQINWQLRESNRLVTLLSSAHLLKNAILLYSCERSQMKW